MSKKIYFVSMHLMLFHVEKYFWQVISKMLNSLRRNDISFVLRASSSLFGEMTNGMLREASKLNICFHFSQIEIWFTIKSTMEWLVCSLLDIDQLSFQPS